MYIDCFTDEQINNSGTRVSLYFKGEEETSAMAVNCIRSGGGCSGSDYRNKTLKTEHGMQLQLN